MRRRFVYSYLGATIPYWNLITVNNKILFLKKKCQQILDFASKWTSKPESRQCNEKAGNLRSKSGDLAVLVDINVFAMFDEIPSITLEDIKETKRYRRSVWRTWRQYTTHKHSLQGV